MEAVPTLSIAGFETNKELIMVKLYEHFMCSEYSQSNVHFGKITSLKYILSEAKDSERLQDMVTEALTIMYSAYYTTVAVEITVNDTDSKISLDVSINATDALGKTYKLNELVRIVNNKITNMDINQELMYV